MFMDATGFPIIFIHLSMDLLGFDVFCIVFHGITQILRDLHADTTILLNFYIFSMNSVNFIDVDGFQKIQEDLGEPLRTSCGPPGRLLRSSGVTLGDPRTHFQVEECKNEPRRRQRGGPEGHSGRPEVSV